MKKSLTEAAKGNRGECESPPDWRRNLGAAAEAACEARIRASGWRVIDRNWRCPRGEIDLVAMDGRTLVIVEVKALSTGRTHGPLLPAEAVGPRKRSRLRMLAARWCADNPVRTGWSDIRFDVVSVLYSPGGAIVGYEHLEAAF